MGAIGPVGQAEGRGKNVDDVGPVWDPLCIYGLRALLRGQV